ncbi:integrase [Actinotalea ferrariae CF5-4]|uniref:Integrase n=1 Tax=Actinotalea ferrariae CF5-4 TaxID=948458 RepID=A0A021VVU1_9CELL|nr:site-specific integrase [Actinotalea ferrariae]EYR65281.1 integrase [Actinotalea ferrariae CF5-4]
MAWVTVRRAEDGKKRYQGRYRDASGAKRTVGTFSTDKAAMQAAVRAEIALAEGTWIDPRAGRITFREYAGQVWLPSRHLEVTTYAAYASNLRIHFIPFFGDYPLARIMPAMVQEWVNQAGKPPQVAGKGRKGLSPRSIVKYHVMLHSIFARAVADRIIPFNPCAATDLPKVITTRTRTLTPDEYTQLLTQIPPRFTVMIMTAIETGLRWGELVALRPRHIDTQARTITVQDTIVEVSAKDSPTGQRMIVKPYPKDDEPRTVTVSQDLIDALTARVRHLGLGPDDLLFPSRETAAGQPLSRATFNTRYWRPAVQRSGINFNVRMHDLRHAHASWLLAGGADLMSVMERMGHAQIQTTQKYLHTLPDADRRTLTAFHTIRTQTSR